MADDFWIYSGVPAATAEDVARGLERFRAILAAYSPTARGFTDFRSGVIDQREGYKLGIHAAARERLDLASWRRLTPGEGKIIGRTIRAIEIPGNNVLTWWPPSTAHRRLIDIAEGGGPELRQIEAQLSDLYLGEDREQEIFNALENLVGKNYPLLGYLFFLKDADRFVPVSPGGLEKGLKVLGVDLPLRGKASWENYGVFLAYLEALRSEISRQAATTVRLIDAHSFVWVLGAWERPDSEGRIAHRGGGFTITDSMDKARIRLVTTILDTIRSANGQTEMRQVKEKNTDMSRSELEAHIRELMARGRTCVLTGCQMLYDGEQLDAMDKHFLVSADRIDSSLGYVRGNIQLVCQFANFFKGHRYSTADMHYLFGRIRAVEVDEDL